MVHLQGGCSMAIKRCDLFDVLKFKSPMRPRAVETEKVLLNHVLRITQIENIADDDLSRLNNTINNYTKGVSERWKKARGFLPKFRTRNEEWLQEVIITSGKINSMASSSTMSRVGRPKKSFADGSIQTKRRIVQEDVSSKTEEELCFAAELKLRAVGKRNAASLFSKIRRSPKRATHLKKIDRDTEKLENVSFSADEALALFISFKLTRHQYIGLRALVFKKGLKKLFPTYEKIIEAKKDCYPPHINVSNTKAEVPLQDLLNHTASRIIKAQQEIMSIAFQDNIEPEIPLNITCKWGSDGSGNQSKYKQKGVDDDSSILATSLVPLQLSFDNHHNKNIILWQNPKSSSTRFCRPIRIQFLKESDEIINSEFSDIENQISQLKPTEIYLNNKKYLIKYHMMKTMVDGKVCNSLMATSSQKCYICKAGPAQFNNLDYIKTLSSNPDSFNLGLSTLHAYIRFFECIIHISYRLDFQLWRVPQNFKETFNRKKQKVIDTFKEQTGLLIDLPKVGFGNTNDGNTARRFFSNTELTSQITGVNEKLIYRFSVILQTLNCGYKINSVLFHQYAYETAQLYVTLYDWYPMPPTVHKILIHSKDVIENFLLPIGQLGEDAQESRHKEIKYFREHNTRKISREKTNLDLFNILLVSSDPFISSLRVLPPKQEHILNSDVVNLLAAPEGV